MPKSLNITLDDWEDNEDIDEVIISEKQFQRWFVSEVKYWVKFFGLTEWECRFELRDDDEHEAMLIPNATAGDATFVLCNTWNFSDFNEKAIRKAAFHEVKELLLYPLREQAENRDFNIENFIKETHRIIRRFENTYFENRWKKLISSRKRNAKNKYI